MSIDPMSRTMRKLYKEQEEDAAPTCSECYYWSKKGGCEKKVEGVTSQSFPCEEFAPEDGE